MISNDCIEAVCAEVRAVGLDPAISPSGKHAAITWHANGVERVYYTALTPSDRRAHLNARGDVRRMLREDGFLPSDEVANVGDRPRLFIVSGAIHCDSRDIAAHFGKAHKNVLQSIDKALEDLGDFGRLNFQPSSYINEQGKSQRCFNLTRDAFTLLAMGFTGPEAMRWKVSYLECFGAMESELRKVATPALSADALIRIERIEGDLAALIDLSLSQPQPEPGFIIIKAHKRRSRMRA